MRDSNPTLQRLAAVVGILALSSACSKRPSVDQSAAGNVDSAVVKTGSVSPAVGPAVQVTRTDSKSVDRSMRYELTEDNFQHFMAAADSIAALEARDSTVRAYLSNNLTDAGSAEPNAGLKWLQSNDAVRGVIESAGISVEDYFVQSLAIADADRFVSDPKAAPPTPTLKRNAKFLAGRQSDLAHLQWLRDNKPAVTVTPR